MDAYACQWRGIEKTGGKIGPLTQKIYDTITGIQLGKLEGPEGWSVEVK